jgi:hypothetical protein
LLYLARLRQFDFVSIANIILAIMALRVPSLPRSDIARALGGLNPAMLVPLVGSLSRAVNTGVASSRALAAALQAAGVQRLSDLQSAAPRVRSTLDKLTFRLPSVHLNVEEIAIIRAVIEFYLGLILQLLMAHDRTQSNTRPPLGRRRDVLPHLLFVPMSRSHRTRIGVLLPPSLIAS